MTEQKLVLNFDGKSTDEIFNIPKERAEEIGSIIAGAVTEIANNYDSYYRNGEGEHAGKDFIVKGKMLERLLRDFADIQERVFVISVFHHMLELAAERAVVLEAQTALADFIEKLKIKV